MERPTPGSASQFGILASTPAHPTKDGHDDVGESRPATAAHTGRRSHAYLRRGGRGFGRRWRDGGSRPHLEGDGRADARGGAEAPDRAGAALDAVGVRSPPPGRRAAPGASPVVPRINETGAAPRPQERGP